MKHFSEFLVCLVMVIAILVCVGSPDIIDSVVYKITGVKNWEN